MGTAALARRVDKRRIFGEHLTPEQVFREYILPRVVGDLYKYIWVDLFAGEGRLVLPLLEEVPPSERDSFFSEHVYLFDIQEEMVLRARRRAEEYGVSPHTARRNIQVRDSLSDYPVFIMDRGLPVFHITNPPYLYLGYISKTPETRHLLKYFSGENQGYQDLYQIAMANDSRHGVEKMVYIVPSNFLYGGVVSDRIRMDVLKRYRIGWIVVLEDRVFEDTGTHVSIVYLERKKKPCHGVQVFSGVKVRRGGTVLRRYRLLPRYRYRAGTEFYEFVERYRAEKPVRFRFYLFLSELREGPYMVRLVDVNRYSGGRYMVFEKRVSGEDYRMIRGNLLFLRTIDTGGGERAGLYVTREVFGADALVVTRRRYRTHPIQVVFEDALEPRDQVLFKEVFNILLEYLRRLTDSEFMTTYRYSRAPYTRKYLGLTQARMLMETIPILEMDPGEKESIMMAARRGDVESIINIIRKYSSRPGDA